jgi:catechol 2,3-dioxygenase-like lactoylglutathione lyase family enzyme
MSRVQLAINVTDLESSIAFYSNLLSIEPAKVREGYANFAVENPPLKLVLMEQTEARGSGIAGALNHLGVEVETADQVAASAARLSEQGMTTDLRENTVCCHALQDKVWVNDPDGVPWEIYTVLADVQDGSATETSIGDRCAGPGCSDSSAASHCC